jgi:hypothetical protein
VDDNCRERLVYEAGIPEDRVRVMLNAVDLNRFLPRGPLPPRPRRALLFSNSAREHNYLRVVREACARLGLALDVVGQGVGKSCARPEEVLGRYDLVFAKARCALEALAVGTAVVLCDQGGVGPLVRAENLGRLRRLNLGRRTLDQPHRVGVLLREIGAYDARDALEVSRRVRAGAGLDAAVDALVALYREVIAEQRGRPPAPAEDELRAAAAYLRGLMPFPTILAVSAHAKGCEQERDRWRDEAEVLRAELEGRRRQVEALRAESQGRAEEVEALRDERRRQAEEVESLRGQVGPLRAESEGRGVEVEWRRGQVEALLAECRGRAEEVEWRRGQVEALLAECRGRAEEVEWRRGQAEWWQAECERLRARQPA